MEKFKYVAVDVDKKRFRGSFLAESESHLREQLAQQNLYLVKCKQVNASNASYGMGMSHMSIPEEVKVGGATIFVLDVSEMEKI